MSSESPRVSILLPVYQAQDTLLACLRSIARQSERLFECIIVDDGSTDESAAIALRFASADPRFVVLSAPHRGLVASLAYGLERCRAPLVARMDADDLMLRRRLERQLHALARERSLAAVGAHVHIFPRPRLTQGLLDYERWLASIDSPERVAREAFVECPIAHPTLVIRTAVLRQLGYRDGPWPEDYDLVLRLIIAGQRLGVVPEKLLLWRDGPTRLSRNDARYSLDAFTACRAHHLAASLLAREHDYVLWGYGGTGKALRRALAEHGKRPKAIVELHPGRLGQRIHGAPVIPPDALAAMRGLPVVVSVAGFEARAQIRSALTAMRFEELRDYVCCA